MHLEAKSLVVLREHEATATDADHSVATSLGTAAGDHMPGQAPSPSWTAEARHPLASPEEKPWTPRPSSTYRLQIRAGFDLDDAAEVVDYLRDLGVDWAYLSPLLRATTGSDHGYDVVDPSQIDPARGGAAGLDRFAAAARSAGLGILVDIVPNHVGVSAPEENPWWWDLLARGRASRYAAAFDVDWAFGGGKVRIPVLGSSVADAVAAAELRVEGDELRYFDHRFPLATGSVSGGARATAADPADAAVLLGVHDGSTTS